MIPEILNFIKQNLKWILLIVLVLFLIIRTRVRKYFWKVRKTGEELTFKQFLGRWKKGVEGISPLQQSKSQVWGIWITISGIVCGLVVTPIVHIKGVWFWVEIILAGSFFITLIQMVGALQKKWILKKVDEEQKKIMKEINSPTDADLKEVKGGNEEDE